jgi:8-oxo-dGTP pyrophosphatase MutT (NUDIX family)
LPTDNRGRRTLRHRVRRALFRAFYGLPGHWRRRLVRVVQPSYLVGAITLVRTDATAPGASPRLLLVQLPGGRGWSLPGGLMDRGESPIQCAVRELAEETGVRLPPERLVPASPNAVVHRHGRWVDCVFETHVPPDTVLSVDGAEVYEARFHPLDALPPLTEATARLLSRYGLGPNASRRSDRSTLSDASAAPDAPR